MPRGDLSEHVSRVKKLALEMNKFVPIGDTQTSEFRSDLAGLYVVAVAAAYESCVKEVLVSYAARNNEMFGQFALANYKKLNSRINMNDLHKYAKTFHPSIGKKFQDNLTLTKDKINRKLGRDIQLMR